VLMDSWVPFLWAWIQVLILIISYVFRNLAAIFRRLLVMAAEDDADIIGVTRLLLPYCSLHISCSEPFLPTSDCSGLIFAVLYLPVVHALHCSPTCINVQVTPDAVQWSPGILDDRFALLQQDFSTLTTVVPMIREWTYMLKPLRRCSLFQSRITRWSFLYLPLHHDLAAERHHG
jgi:hypothetical protein